MKKFRAVADNLTTKEWFLYRLSKAIMEKKLALSDNIGQVNWALDTAKQILNVDVEKLSDNELDRAIDILKPLVFAPVLRMLYIARLFKDVLPNWKEPISNADWVKRNRLLHTFPTKYDEDFLFIIESLECLHNRASERNKTLTSTHEGGRQPTQIDIVNKLYGRPSCVVDDVDLDNVRFIIQTVVEYGIGKDDIMQDKIIDIGRLKFRALSVYKEAILKRLNLPLKNVFLDIMIGCPQTVDEMDKFITKYTKFLTAYEKRTKILYQAKVDLLKAEDDKLIDLYNKLK